MTYDLLTFTPTPLYEAVFDFGNGPERLTLDAVGLAKSFDEKKVGDCFGNWTGEVEQVFAGNEVVGLRLSEGKWKVINGMEGYVGMAKVGSALGVDGG